MNSVSLAASRNRRFCSASPARLWCAMGYSLFSWFLILASGQSFCFPLSLIFSWFISARAISNFSIVCNRTSTKKIIILFKNGTMTICFVNCGLPTLLELADRFSILRKIQENTCFFVRYYLSMRWTSQGNQIRRGGTNLNIDKKFGLQATAVEEWLPWGGIVRPDVMKQKDGSMFSIIEYEPYSYMLDAEYPKWNFRRGWVIWQEIQHT